MHGVEGQELQRPKFNWEINLGHVLTIATLLIGLAVAYSTYQVTTNDHESRIRYLEVRSNNLDGRFSEIGNTINLMSRDLAIIKYRLETDKLK